jgi:hypothetical protein
MVNIGATTNGYDYNFFGKFNITATSMPTTPQCFINLSLPCSGFSLQNEGLHVVQYSFNGKTIHGDLTPGTPLASIMFQNRVASKIFFFVPDGYSSGINVRVEAWVSR